MTIDCDAGSSEVNQLNRLKLMLTVARRARQRELQDPIAFKSGS